MRLLTYNVNGIRAALKNGLIDWLTQHPADVLCFQEVKATHDVVDLTPFEALGYTYHWHAAEKKGYSGVATFSKRPPTMPYWAVAWRITTAKAVSSAPISAT